MMAVRGNSHRLVASVLRSVENNIDSKINSIPKQSPPMQMKTFYEVLLHTLHEV